MEEMFKCRVSISSRHHLVVTRNDNDIKVNVFVVTGLHLSFRAWPFCAFVKYCLFK